MKPSGESTAPRRRRILYVHNSADLYGASRSLLRLLTVLDRTRFEPVVVLPESGRLEDRIKSLGVAVTIDPSLAIISRYSSKVSAIFRHFPVSSWKLSRLIRRKKIDLVHTNAGVVFSPAFAAWLAGVPHVWHIRESFDEFRGGIWEGYAAFMRMFSVRIVSVSNANAAQFSDRSKVVVIHNGFPLEDFPAISQEQRRQARERFGLVETDFVTGCVGRLKWVRKGQEYLIQAAHLLKKRGWQMKHLIVGSPYVGNESHLDRLQALVRDLDLENEIIFTGELQDTRPAYAAMDLFVLPSAQPEPFGGVVIEAMANRLPVIATNIGGSLDQVDDDVTGFLVPPGDPEALATKIEILARDPDCRLQMGVAGRARVTQLFDLNQMVIQMQDLYEDVLTMRK